MQDADEIEIVLVIAVEDQDFLIAFYTPAAQIVDGGTSHGSAHSRLLGEKCEGLDGGLVELLPSLPRNLTLVKHDLLREVFDSTLTSNDRPGHGSEPSPNSFVSSSAQNSGVVMIGSEAIPSAISASNFC